MIINLATTGSDSLLGGNENDFFEGDSGDDLIVGGNHDDSLEGDSGDDLALFKLRLHF